jgi:GAF domain-containing protein
MADSFLPQHPQSDKADRYAALLAEVDAVLKDENNVVARMASIASMLATAFETFSWVGFYVVDPLAPLELVVGPYQGALGCLRIAFGRGVCGTVALSGRTLIVPDVDAFPGHIACDARTRSEIVTPVVDGEDRLFAVLDVDSTTPDAFDATDEDVRKAPQHRSTIVIRVSQTIRVAWLVRS